MAVRRELILIIALIIIIAVLVKAIEFFQLNVVEADASNFVKEDLRNKYPAADIEIMSILPLTNTDGARYFEVKAKVTESPDTQCPERTHIFYNYPAQNFVAQLPEAITRNCAVCTDGICTIAFQEEAIIASHTLPGTEKIRAYLREFSNAAPIVEERADSWVVSWDSQTANYYYIVELHRDGSVVESTKSDKA